MESRRLEIRNGSSRAKSIGKSASGENPFLVFYAFEDPWIGGRDAPLNVRVTPVSLV